MRTPTGLTMDPMRTGETDDTARHEEIVAGLLDLLDRADNESRESRAEVARLRAEIVKRDTDIVNRDAEIQRLRALLNGWAMWPARVLWRAARRSMSLMRRNG